MAEEIKINEFKNNGTIFYKYISILSINQVMSDKEAEYLKNRIIEVAKEVGESDSRLIKIQVRSPKEYYQSCINSVLYNGWWCEESEYPSYIDEEDKAFLDSMFPKFISNCNIYYPGTIVEIYVVSDLTTTIGIIKNEITSGIRCS